MSRKLTDILEECRIMAQNAANDAEIKKALLAFGYPEERLDSGLTLYTKTKNLFDIQNKENLEKEAAIIKFIEARETCEDDFAKVSKLSKVCLRGNSMARNILPDYPMPNAFASWRKSASDFYNNIILNPEALANYSQFGYNAKRLQTLISELNSTETLMNTRAIESGEAQNATQQRDISFAELKSYRSDLRVVAKIALANKPQLLEKLGITVRN